MTLPNPYLTLKNSEMNDMCMTLVTDGYVFYCLFLHILFFFPVSTTLAHGLQEFLLNGDSNGAPTMAATGPMNFELCKSCCQCHSSQSFWSVNTMDGAFHTLLQGFIVPFMWPPDPLHVKKPFLVKLKCL